MKTNQEYKNLALDRLRGNWAPAVIPSLVFYFILLAIFGGSWLPYYVPTLPSLFALVPGGLVFLLYLFVFPLDVGFMNAFRVFYERRDDRLTGNMFELGFSAYWHNVGGMFFYGLKLWLWFLLFIVPGFIMCFAYAMTPFILNDHPELSAWEASRRSEEMMRGHKWRLFCLELSFIGWYLLAILTFGIGLLWLIPYVTTSLAAFYNDLKAEQGEEAVTE